MPEIFYEKSTARNLNQLKELAPEQLKALNEFSGAVFKAGALTVKEKEIIAVQITLVTECPYCIDFHTKKAKKAGATLEELTEASFVTLSVEAGSAVTHSTNVHNALDPESSDDYYSRSNLKNLPQLGKYAPDAFKAYQNFSAVATKEGKLSAKFKEIIATAVGVAVQCPYCIDVHTKKAEKLGATNEELAEALMVVSSLKAGGAYAHIAHIIQSYQE